MTTKDVTIDEMFPSKYLRAADLSRKGMTLTINAVEQEQLGNDDKWVLYFTGGEERGLPRAIRADRQGDGVRRAPV